MLIHARSERTLIVRAAFGAALLLAGLPAAAAAAAAPVAAPVIDVAPVGAGRRCRATAAIALGSAAGCARGRRSPPAALAVACLVNRARAAAPACAASAATARSSRAAGRHARDMARGRFFAHQRSGGPSLRSRARAAGWRGGRLGEAIAYGCGEQRQAGRDRALVAGQPAAQGDPALDAAVARGHRHRRAARRCRAGAGRRSCWTRGAEHGSAPARLPREAADREQRRRRRSKRRARPARRRARRSPRRAPSRPTGRRRGA